MDYSFMKGAQHASHHTTWLIHYITNGTRDNPTSDNQTVVHLSHDHGEIITPCK